MPILLAYEATQLSFLETGSDVREVHHYLRALEYGLKRTHTLPIRRWPGGSRGSGWRVVHACLAGKKRND